MDSEPQHGGVDTDLEPGGGDDPPLYTFGTASDRLRSITDSVMLIVGSFLAGIALIVLSASVLQALGVFSGGLESAPVEVEAAIVALQFVGFILVGVAYLNWRGDSRELFDVRVPSLVDVGWAAAGLVSLFVAITGVSIVISQLGVETAQNAAITRGQQRPVFFLYLMVVAIVFTAPAEELLFRGLIQGLFRKAYGIIPGLIIASALFGVVHYLALSGSGKITYVAVAAALGLILGAAYEKTGNLAVPILIHGAYNAILFYVNYLNATGQLASLG